MPKIADIYPLSPTQEGLLFHSLLAPEDGLYVPQIILSLSGKLDATRLRECWQLALQNHEILRSSFHWEQRDDPFQVVHEALDLAWTEIDWSALTQEEQVSKLSILQEANRFEGFSLQRPPLMRLHLIRFSKESHRLVWCYHHLLLDGWSAGLVMKEVLHSYLSGIKPPPTKNRYADYIAWLNKQDQQAALGFWEKRLLHSAGQTNSHREDTQEPAELTFRLSTEEAQRLRTWTQEHQITLHTALLGALGILRSHSLDSREVVLGHTVSGRPESLARATEMVGLFINTLPVPLSLSPSQKIIHWLQGLQEQQAEASEYEHVSLRNIQTWTNGGAPLFDWLFVLESYPLSPDAVEEEKELSLTGIDFDEWTHFPLSILASEGDSLTIKAKFQTSAFSREEINRLLADFYSLLQIFLQKPETRLGEITLATETERQQIRKWNDTEKAWPTEIKTIRDKIELHRTSSSEAVRFENESLSHQELHQKADQLAAHLKELGAGPEKPVAVYLERSSELPLSILAILKAGAVYTPLDPSYPKSRLEALLQECSPSVLITNRAKHLPALSSSCPVIDWDTFVPDDHQKLRHLVELDPQQAAYLIYTSGSTGQPKGVINTHQAIRNRLLWKQEKYQLQAKDRVLQKTPVGFDVSVWEFYWPLMNGASLVIAPPEIHRDSEELAALIQREKITVLHFVPPMLDALLDVATVADCSSLRLILCSGDSLTPRIVERCREKLPHAALHNLYGPTEAAIDVTSWAYDSELKPTIIPIGHPISNTAIHLLNQDLHEVTQGAEGDLYIAGQNLARAYANRPDLTAESFIPNPFRSDQSTSELLYRTGDRARYLDDGSLEFLGRNDHQVKIRGQRVELSEIETALLQHTSIERAIVTFEEERLTAYVSGKGLETDSASSFADDLRENLTEAMIPQHWFTIEKWPLTSNGKIDRKALPKVYSHHHDQLEELSGDTQLALAAIWQEVLKLEKIGANSHFFRLGGHSLTATRVNTRIKKHFALKLPLRAIFEFPVLADLAQHLDESSSSSEETSDHLEIKI